MIKLVAKTSHCLQNIFAQMYSCMMLGDVVYSELFSVIKEIW